MTRNQELMRNLIDTGWKLLFLSMCIGLIDALALPSYFAQRDKAKESEPKIYVSSMNRAQQAYFEDKNAFATSVDALGLGIKSETTNFKYSVSITKQAAFNYGISKDEKIRSYVGGVFLIQVKPNAAKNEIKTEMILCVADKPGKITPLPPRLQNGKLFCGTGTTIVTR